MNRRIAEIASRHFNPRTLMSGTEQMAPLLYALIRMTRPATVVEYGTGYSTLFILQELADGLADYDAEREELLQKSHASGILGPDAQEWSGATPEFRRWFAGGGRASAVDAAHYLEPYQPHLYCFENNPEDHPYRVALRAAIEEAPRVSDYSRPDLSSLSHIVDAEQIIEIEREVERFALQWLSARNA